MLRRALASLIVEVENGVYNRQKVRTLNKHFAEYHLVEFVIALDCDSKMIDDFLLLLRS